MSDIYVNGHMSITSFKVYRQTASGSWVTANSLFFDGRYRFRFYCVNRSAPNTLKYDHVFIRIKSDYRTIYYKSSEYTGNSSTLFESERFDTSILGGGNGKTIYAYFIWHGIDGMLVNTFSPQVMMTARELRHLPYSPYCPLFPNVQ